MKRFFAKLGFSGSEKKLLVEPPALRWILTNELAVGPIPTPTIHAQLVEAGIKAVLSLCAEQEGQLPIEVQQDFYWKRWVLPDSYYEESMSVERLAQAVEFVHQAISRKLPIYVHCLAGVERSPTVCVAYLCVHRKMELWEALNWLKQTNPRTSLMGDQVKAIQGLVRMQQAKGKESAEC